MHLKQQLSYSLMADATPVYYLCGVAEAVHSHQSVTGRLATHLSNTVISDKIRLWSPELANLNVTAELFKEKGGIYETKCIIYILVHSLTFKFLAMIEYPLR